MQRGKRGKPKDKDSNTAQKIQELINAAWPEGVIEMPDEDFRLSVRYDKLKRKLEKMPSVRVHSEPVASLDDDLDFDDDDEIEEEREVARSYRLFLIEPRPAMHLPFDEDVDVDGHESPEEEPHDFGDEYEGFIDDEEPAVIGYRFCFLVAVSLVAPVSMVMDYAMEETEYGTDSSLPTSLPAVCDSAGKPCEPDHVSELGEKERKVAEAIRQKIVRALDESGILVLSFEERSKEATGLKGGGEVFLEEPIRIENAFFFEGP